MMINGDGDDLGTEIPRVLAPVLGNINDNEKNDDDNKALFESRGVAREEAEEQASEIRDGKDEIVDNPVGEKAVVETVDQDEGECVCLYIVV